MMRTLIPAMLAAGLIAAGCGSGDGESTSGAAAEPAAADSAADEGGGGRYLQGGDKQEQEPKPEPKGTRITTAGSPFGEVLFDGQQRAIYLFDKEGGSKSECYGECAAAWPPVLTKGPPAAKGEVALGKLGTTKRDDGTTQVTYDGHPLYYYVDDPSGVVGCHNVSEFGGLWLAVEPSGNPA